jgi:hypothetical protein
MMHAQIFSENLITNGFWNSTFLCYFMNGQTTIGVRHFRNFLNLFFIFWLKVIRNVHCPQLEFGPLYNVCTTHGFVFYSWLHPQMLF